MDEIILEFLVESREGIDQLDQDFLVLENDPNDSETLARIFRVIHTIKGTCGFLGFSRLERLTHQGENLLSLLRNNEMSLNPGMTTALLHMVDGVRKTLQTIEATEADGTDDFADLIVILQSHADGTFVSDAVIEPEPTTTEPDSDLYTNIDTFDEPGEAEAPSKLQPQAQGTDNSPQHKPTAAPETTASKTKPPANGGSIRVDVRLLDNLMNLVGELVLSRNQLLQFSGTIQDSSFHATTQRLNLITSELQEGVMKTRMQQIGRVWNKLPRVVRDLSIQCGKQVRVEMEGKETELDKTLIEAIKDPLTHIVRNSIDHGIESPEDRIASGKAAEGILLLRAYHEGGQVIIEIIDDGGGINGEKVRDKAVSKGLISAEQGALLSTKDMVNLIFLPGLSTAETITNVSGRGVGMDVVRTNIEKIGGSIELDSTMGEGTTLKIKIPLTLAIIPALVVSQGKERFAIPQVSLLELVRFEGKTIKERIEHVHGAPVCRLRGKLLPLVYLDQVLNLPPTPSDDTEEPVVNIVVLQADDQSFGLIVDEINDTEEIVVKPLSKTLKGVACYAGATIMGDGKVALILDVLGFSQYADLATAPGEHGLGLSMSNAEDAEIEDTIPMLLFSATGSDQMAVNLEEVARLEEFATSAVEATGTGQVIQYRDNLLPLINLGEVLGNANYGYEEESTSSTIQVIVYSHENRSVGLIVSKIIDIVDEPVVFYQKAPRTGIQGVTVLKKIVTEVVDVKEVVEQYCPQSYTAPQFVGA